MIDLEGEVSELKTVTSSLGELPERVAETDQRVGALEGRVDGLGTAGGSDVDSKLPWYLAGGALGLAGLLGLLFSRTGRSRGHDQIERLSNRLTDLDLRHRDLEETTRTSPPIPLAAGLAGGAKLVASDSPSAASQTGEIVAAPEPEPKRESPEPTHEPEPEPVPEPVVAEAEPEPADEVIPHVAGDELSPEPPPTPVSREDFDRSLVERIQEQYLSSLEKDGGTSSEPLTGAEADFEPSALDPPWKPLSPLTHEEEFRGRFESESRRAIEDLGRANSEETPESDDEDSSFV